MNKYADATLMDLTRLAGAANRLYNCIAEFPDSPECWGEALEYFDIAVESCPGTAAHYHMQQQRLNPKDEFWETCAYNEYCQERKERGVEPLDFTSWQEANTSKGSVK